MKKAAKRLGGLSRGHVLGERTAAAITAVEGIDLRAASRKRLAMKKLKLTNGERRSEEVSAARRKGDLLFRWFVGTGVDDAPWGHSVFSKNCDPLLEGDIAALVQRKVNAWNSAFLDLVEEDLAFKGSADSEIAFVLEGFLDLRYGIRDGSACAKFPWEGYDENDPVCGRGWIVFDSRPPGRPLLYPQHPRFRFGLRESPTSSAP